MIRKAAIMILLSSFVVSAETGFFDRLFGDGKSSCFPLISKTKAGDIVWRATGWTVTNVTVGQQNDEEPCYFDYCNVTTERPDGVTSVFQVDGYLGRIYDIIDL